MVRNNVVLSSDINFDKVAEKVDVSKKDIKSIIDALLTVTTEEVGKGNEIRLIGFGTFKMAERAARKGRNPRSGEEIEIPASKSLAFKSSVKY
jgi:DNA-binding protein HU-beta